MFFVPTVTFENLQHILIINIFKSIFYKFNLGEEVIMNLNLGHKEKEE